ncbi:MAG: heme ABC transporter ATP-binding protein [Myxococcota bacterium]
MTLALDSVRLARGGRVLLHARQLEFAAGRLTAVLGPNGAGKTTLLKLLAGELKPDRGRVTLDGEALETHGLEGLARRRAVLPQLSGLRFPFTVDEVVRLGRLPHGDAHAPAGRAAVERALRRTDLLALREAPYPRLSGGERQRVHWARAWAQIDAPETSAPRWLLLDEPTSALDLKHVHALLQEAQDFAGSGGGVVLVLHDPNLAARYADDVTLVTQGEAEAAASVGEVLRADRLSAVYDLSLERIDRPGQAPIILPKI